MLTVGFTTFAFCHMRLGMAGGLVVIASVAIGEATRDSIGDDDNGDSIFYRLEAKAVALASMADHFFDGSPPLVLTILKLTKREEQRKNGVFGLRGNDERKKIKLGLEHPRFEYYR